MQTYSEMVDSGVDWIGEIPKGWGLRRFSRIIKVQKGKKVDALGDGLPILDMSYLREGGEPASFGPKETEERYRVKDDDLLVLWDGSKAGEFIKARNGVVGSTLASLKSDISINDRYLFYLAKAQEKYLQDMTNGMGIPHVDRRILMSLIDFRLDFRIQQKIADFLDTETAQIDNLIAKQERLLELLEEKRRATITHAVTRGLNPNVELKETNIPWLGQIPAHWTVEKFSNLYLNTNAGEVIPKEYWDPNGVELLYTASQNPIHSNFAAFPQQKRTSRGDILIARNGDGVIHDPQPDSIYTNVVQRIRLDTLRLDKGYIIYALKASLGYVHGQSNGDFIVSLNMGMWNKTRLALPKLSEQRVIREHLDSELEKNERLKQKIQTQITLLRERRTSLISHAVTGKIKV